MNVPVTYLDVVPQSSLICITSVILLLKIGNFGFLAEDWVTEGVVGLNYLLLLLLLINNYFYFYFLILFCGGGGGKRKKLHIGAINAGKGWNFYWLKAHEMLSTRRALNNSKVPSILLQATSGSHTRVFDQKK